MPATTTTRPITELTLGVRDITGAVVPSGKARFYLPGTLTATQIYSDELCTTAITQPLELNAGGQYKSAYALEATRMIVKDTTETTTYYDGLVNVNRHDAVYVTHPLWNSGDETTLENILTLLGVGIGASGEFVAGPGATPIPYPDFLTSLLISVKSYGAVGDGITDDAAAIQAAVDRVEALGGGWVFFPVGTYRINVAIVIDAVGVCVTGAGRMSIVKNFGTTTNAFTVNVAGDCKTIFRDLAITANTTSSGAGITFTAGDYPTINNVEVALHRTGISVSAVSIARLHHVKITSSDDNAAAVGVALGAGARLADSEIICGTTNGTGVTTATGECRIASCYLERWATAINMTSAGSLAVGCYVTAAGTTGVAVAGTDCSAHDCDVFSSTIAFSITGTRAGVAGCSARTGTTGYNVGVAHASIIGCTAALFTTGFSVGAFDGCRVTGCVGTTNTTDITINAAATLLVEHSNVFTTISDAALTPHTWMKDRGKVARIVKSTSAVANPAFTPTPQVADFFVCDMTLGAGNAAPTINATVTTGLIDGQRFSLVVQRQGAAGTSTAPVFNAQYVIGSSAGIQPSSGQYQVVEFVWRASTSKWLAVLAAAPAVGGLGTGGFW
jgi:hypothetical protein